MVKDYDEEIINKAFYNLTKRMYIGKFFNTNAVSLDVKAWLKRMSASSLDMYHMLLVIWHILNDEKFTNDSRVQMKDDIASLLNSIDAGKKEESSDGKGCTYGRNKDTLANFRLIVAVPDMYQFLWEVYRLSARPELYYKAKKLIERIDQKRM